jgi:hypothetical protein
MLSCYLSIRVEAGGGYRKLIIMIIVIENAAERVAVCCGALGSGAV